MNIKFDKTLLVGIAGGALMLAGNIMKAVSDKKANDGKLAELVEKAVEEKLKNK